MKKRYKRLKILNVPHDLMIEMLEQEYGDHAEVVDVTYNFDRDAWRVKFRHPDWQEVGEGEVIPGINLWIPMTPKSVRYDELIAAIKDHYEGGPIPEAFAEHVRKQ